jgi:hypothetical protein
MKQTQNQFYGKDNEKSGIDNLANGTIFVATDTNRVYVAGQAGMEEAGMSSSGASFKGLIYQEYTITEDVETGGVYSKITLDGDVDASGTSWMRGANFRIENVSTTDQTQITGVRGNATHSSTGDIDFVVGGDHRAYASGSGNANSVQGSFAFASLSGVGAVADFAYAENAALSISDTTVNNAIGNNTNVAMYAGSLVTEFLDVHYLTFTDSGGAIGTVSVDAEFNYLKIGASVPSTIFGEAYAINSLADLPSKLTGTLSAKTLSTTGYTVATLPAGVLGDRAYVTDATTPTYLAALTGGGAVNAPVFYDGAAWVSA